MTSATIERACDRSSVARRRIWPAVALFVLLTLGLFEPLACIIHCQIWLPHARAAHSHTAAGFDGGTAEQALGHIRTSAASGRTLCSVHKHVRADPEVMRMGLPAPFHELQPAPVVALLTTLVLSYVLVRVTPLVLQHVPRPLLRPPIGCTA